MDLRVETNLPLPSYNYEPTSPDVPSPTTPTTREKARSLSHGLLPQLRSPSADKTQFNAEKLASLGTEKAKLESRKALLQVITHLENRPLPPPILEGSDTRPPQARRGLGAVVRSLSSRGKGKGAATTQPNSGSDSEDDYLPGTRPLFYTDHTLNYMIQLKDALRLAIAKGWDLFATDPSAPMRKGSYEKPKRKRRLSSQTRSRSRSSSPNRGADEAITSSELLARCISVISTVITEDSRFKVYRPTPLQPPNSLQACTLDCAQYLLHIHRFEPKILSQIGFAVIPAFQTFPHSMHFRLIMFFEEGVLGSMLEGLQRIQGKELHSQNVPGESHTDVSPSDDPVVSIQVEEVQDEVPQTPDRWQRWMKARGATGGFHSTTTADQEIAVYYLSSLVEPLLSVILDKVDVFHAGNASTGNAISQQFHTFFGRLIQAKPDVYLDLLGVIAYHTPRSREAALSVLAFYWPKSIGHIIISRPLAELPFSPKGIPTARQGSISQRMQAIQDHPYLHQFVPWRFVIPSQPVIFEAFAPNRCRVCSDSIEGFGLLCTLCMCAVHFDCYDYPDGSFFTEYSLQSDPNIQKVAVHRFCHILPSRRGSTDLTYRKEQHTFRKANIFSLSLCCVCRKPLWGTVSQGYKCNACHLFTHSSCLSRAAHPQLPRCRGVTVDSSFMTIPYSSLRRSFVEHYEKILLRESDLPSTTHEELSVYFSTLWTQLQILNNGVALGSIVVSNDSTSQSDDERHIEEFELHYLVKLYQAYLSSGRPPISTALLDYLSENRVRAQDHLLWFDWNTLAFITSTIKQPPSSDEMNPSIDTSALLSVGQAGGRGDSGDEDSMHPYEIATLAHLRDRMGDMLGIHADPAARHLLVHLHHLGLFERVDSQPDLFDENPDPQHLLCSFPLPFGFDISQDVETMAATIEACLSDISLSINEIGFLLLVRRFWPNGMLSEYTFRRLARAILGWVLSEDGSLIVILREYVARTRNAPGVRSGEIQPWPPQALARPTATMTASNGGDYVASRKALVSRYAAPWLLALHDLDITAYPGTLFEILSECVDEGAPFLDHYLLGEVTPKEKKEHEVTMMDRLLRGVIKVSQASVTFTAFDDLFQHWLERMQMLGHSEEPVVSIPRIFNREDGTQRHSLVFEGRSSVADIAGLANVNPLQKLVEIAFANREGYRRALRWLCIFAASGVEIPVAIFGQFAASASTFQVGLEDCLVLIKAALYAAWLRPIGRQDLQVVAAILHAYTASDLVEKIAAKEKEVNITEEPMTFIRLSFAMCLLLFGCDRAYLGKLGMIHDDEIQQLPSRRKIGSRASTMSDPIIVDARIMTAIKLYVEQQIDQLSCLVAKFLNAFVNEASLVESYEVDNFILRNCATLCACTWDFYAVQSPELSLTRASLFVRVMVIDAQPFHSLLADLLSNVDWEVRLEAALRLFRIILDVTSPSFVVEDRQWGPSVIEVFYHFFSLLWSDQQEELRSTVDTWTLSLLPAHFDAIASCWNEALAKVTISERIRLVSFLSQLRSHFPTWKMLQWETIIEALQESDFGANDEDGAAAHLSFYGITSEGDEDRVKSSDSETVLLRISLVSLSLRMAADGIPIDIFSLLKLKDQVVRAFGFQDIVVVPSPNGHTFHIRFGIVPRIPPAVCSCVPDLMLILDSPRAFDLSCSAMGGPNVEDATLFSSLVGSAFVDVLLRLVIELDNLTSLPPLALKGLLKSLIIVIHKHDFDSKPLRHLQQELRNAVRRCLTLLQNETQVSLELRQMCLSVCQAFIKRWPNVIGVFIYEAIESSVKTMVALNFEDNHEDVLANQARSFLEGVMVTFWSRGILHALFKKPLGDDFFKALNAALSTKQSNIATPHGTLRDALFHDTLARLMDNDLDGFQMMLINLNKFVEIVHPSRYTADFLQFVGSNIANAAYKITDIPTDTIDASAMVLMCATLIQNNKAQSRDFLPHVEATLRVVLAKCKVSPLSLNRILQVTSSLYRRAEQRQPGVAVNQVALVFADAMSDLLSGKTRPISSSLVSATEVVLSNIAVSCIPPDRAVKLSEGAVQFLYAFNAASPWHQDFTICQAVTKMVLQSAEQQTDLLRPLDSNMLNVRTWNMILLAALSLPSNRCLPLILAHFHAFSFSYYTSLDPRLFMAAEQQGSGDVDISNISRAYVSIKLWLLVIQKAAQPSELDTGGSRREHLEISGTEMVWNELWPPFEAIVNALSRDGAAANSLLLAASSVADLFLFLHQLGVVVALETSSQVSMLNQLLRSNSRLESKVSRVLRAMTDAPPTVVLETFVSQIGAEIAAEEKLEAARLQDTFKSSNERGRRMAS